MATNDNIYTKIMKIRQEFSETEITKSGHNKFQHFKYLELSDFIPVAIKLCNKYGLYTHVDIGLQLTDNKEDHFAVMNVTNTENTNEALQYRLKLPDIHTESGKQDATKQIQDMGKLETYVRRYLYMLFLDIAVPDTVDAGKPTTNNSSNFNKSTNSKRTDTPKKTLKQYKQEKQAQKEAKKQEENHKTEYETQKVNGPHRPRPNTDLQTDDPEPLRTYTNQIVRTLRNMGKDPIRKYIWIEATQRCKDGRIPSELKDDLQAYIMSHCPEEL